MASKLDISSILHYFLVRSVLPYRGEVTISHAFELLKMGQPRGKLSPRSPHHS